MSCYINDNAKTGYIYCWKNLVTNKYYIGKTYSKENRYEWFTCWDSHYAGPHIDKARKKYNDLKYWDYSILYEYNSDDRADLRKNIDEKEIYYISLYNSNDKHKGYNISSGGTYGDTFAALTDEERQERINRQVTTLKSRGYKWMNNGVDLKKVQKSEQQEYLDNGWVYGKTQEVKNKTSEGLQKYYNTPEFKALHEQSLIRKAKRQEEYRKKLKEERAMRDATPEWQERIKANKEKSRQNRIAYNKSEAHRQSAIESNKRRWKDGCPEKTRQKMRESQLKAHTKGKYCWVSKNNDRLYIEKIYLEKYLEDGWHRGRK